MRVLLFQLDGKIPNLALMRLASHHRDRGDNVELFRTGQPERTLWDGTEEPGAVYGSAIFLKSAPAVESLRRAYPNANHWRHRRRSIAHAGIDSACRLNRRTIPSIPTFGSRSVSRSADAD